MGSRSGYIMEDLLLLLLSLSLRLGRCVIGNISSRHVALDSDVMNHLVKWVRRCQKIRPRQIMFEGEKERRL